MTIYNFGSGPVPAHRHRNPDGSAGGWVADSSKIGTNVTIAETATVASRCKIGNRSTIGYECTLGNGCAIGNDCVVGNYCKFGWSCTIGDGCALYNKCKLGIGCSIGDYCVLKNNCKLGCACKLGSHCRLCAETTWEVSPLQLQLPYTLVHATSPDRIRSGCVEASIEEITEEFIRRRCKHEGYSSSITDQYVKAILWMVSFMKTVGSPAHLACGL